MAADGDTLATLGQKLTGLFASAYAAGNPNVSLAFLPFSAPAPDDIVQNGVVNPTRMTQFLVANFDAPYLVSPSDNSAHGKDTYYGAISQIYASAVTLARSAAAPGSDAASRVNAEIVVAQSLLNPAGVSVTMGCEPDDWVLDSNTSYWTVFDSTMTQPAPAAGETAPVADGNPPPPARPLALNPALWTIRSEAVATAPVARFAAIHTASPALSRPFLASAVMMRPEIAVTSSPAASQVARPFNATLLSRVDRFRPISEVSTYFPPSPPPAPSPPPPPPPPPPSSSVAIHFEYMSVAVGYMAAGVPVLNNVFLADRNWYVSGLPRGGLLPDPNAGTTPPATPLVYGVPTSLVIVRNMSLNVKWAGQEQASLGTSGGFLGPFSLSGITPNIAPDGTWTYARPGMQVIALLCGHLPVLPPIDAPDLASPPSSPPATPATTPAPGGP